MITSVPVRQIINGLVRSLPSAFGQLCVRRYGVPLSLRRVEGAAPSSPPAQMYVDQVELPPLDMQLTVHHVGGNEVQAASEDGDSQTFSYCLPEPAPLPVSETPRLAQDVSAFLLDALERRLGSDGLRNELRGGKTETGRPSAGRPVVRIMGL